MFMDRVIFGHAGGKMRVETGLYFNVSARSDPTSPSRKNPHK